MGKRTNECANFMNDMDQWMHGVKIMVLYSWSSAFHQTIGALHQQRWVVCTDLTRFD